MKPAALVHLDNTNENRIARLRKAIEAKRMKVEELTVTAKELKSEVDMFERRYNARISRYYLELDKVELETKEYYLRLQLRRSQVNEEEIEGRVESCFRASRARIDAYAASKESQPVFREDKPSASKTRQLQKLYRNLAKQHHPDKAPDAEEEKRRERLMPLINRAYQEGDFQTLERLTLGDTEAHITEKTDAEKQKALQAEIQRLNRAASELRLEINRLKSGHAYQLKKQVETAKEMGNDLLSGLSKDLDQRVKAGRAHLARLINMWHRAER